MTKINSFINYCNDMIITNESYNKSKHMIISCFAGVGKSYAIDTLSNNFTIDNIDKYRNFYDIYPTRNSYMDDIRKRSLNVDILFIPYFLNMNPRYIDNGINYILIYPDKSLKQEYIKRFKELHFTNDEIAYLIENFDDMIDDCDNQNIPNQNKFKLSKNEFCLDVINEIMNKKRR